MISIIVAVAKNGVIGSDNKLIWHISEDLKRFKRLTTGHPVVMGRKTFESLGRPLPNRQNVVITRTVGATFEGATTVNSIDEALKLFADQPLEEVFIIGGGEIYAQSILLADRMYITEVDQTPEGDTCFPEIDKSVWEKLSVEDHDGYSFVDYARRK